PDPTSLLKACVGLVVTSRSHSGGPETFGRTVIEAWAQGKPVIAYNCGAVGELIDHGVDGVLIDEGDTTALADAMRTLIESPQTCQRLGQAGLEKVKRLYEAGAVTNLLIDRVFSSDGIQRKSTPTDTPASFL
ncbi:MAG: glycosyltransferase family 4 protein, partial [Haliea sp.]|nr:glycosyltransferase family 4 protein [Haliea sp.]